MKRTLAIVIAISVIVIGSAVGFGLVGTAKGEKVAGVEALYLTLEEMPDFEYRGTYSDIGMQRWWYTEECNNVTHLTQILIYFLGVADSSVKAEELAADYLTSLEPGSFSGEAIGDECWSELRDTYSEANLLMIKHNAVIYLRAGKTIVLSDNLIAQRIELETEFPTAFNFTQANREELEKIRQSEEFEAALAEYGQALEENGYQKQYGWFDEPEIDPSLIEQVAKKLEEKIEQRVWTSDEKLAGLPDLDNDPVVVPGIECLLPTNEEMAGFQFYGSSGRRYEWDYGDTAGSRTRISMHLSVFSSPDQARMWARLTPYSSIVLSPGSPSGVPVGDECWSPYDGSSKALLFVKDNAVVYLTRRELSAQESNPALLEEVAHMLIEKIENRNWSPLEVTTSGYYYQGGDGGIVPSVDALLLSTPEIPQCTLDSTLSPVRVCQYDSPLLEEVFDQGKRQIWLSMNGQTIEVEIFVAPTNNLAEQFAATSWAGSRFSLTRRELLLGGRIGDVCWSTGKTEYPYRAVVTFLKENAVVFVSAEAQGSTPVDMVLVDDIAIEIEQQIATLELES
jgi:hypothetical protein